MIQEMATRQPWHDADLELLLLQVGDARMSPGEIVEIEPLHQRSLCYRLVLRDATTLFLKCATRDAEGRWSADLGHEGRLLEDLANCGLDAPRVQLLIDTEDTRLIVTDFLTNHRTFDRQRFAPEVTAIELASDLGSALARVHAVSVPPGSGTLSRPTFPLAGPLMAWTVLTPRQLSEAGPGHGEFVRRMVQLGVPPLLETLRSGWCSTSLIHGDLKFDNILCPVGSGATVRLIDWELSGMGDPGWDVGAVLGSYLYAWVTSFNFALGASLSAWIDSAPVPLADIHHETRAFSDAYTRARDTTDLERATWLRYAAAFLLERASASAYQTHPLPARDLATLQVAAQLLARPDQFLEMLL